MAQCFFPADPLSLAGASTWRPFLRRALRTARPLLVSLRVRNPEVLLRFLSNMRLDPHQPPMAPFNIMVGQGGFSNMLYIVRSICHAVNCEFVGHMHVNSWLPPPNVLSSSPPGSLLSAAHGLAACRHNSQRPTHGGRLGQSRGSERSCVQTHN